MPRHLGPLAIGLAAASTTGGLGIQRMKSVTSTWSLHRQLDAHALMVAMLRDPHPTVSVEFRGRAQ
jgi:hypothetical protein